MSNINNHEVGMNKINLAGNFQDLTCEQAATIQGGAQIIVYTDANFQGDSLSVTADSAGQQYQFTDKFNNSISSAKVISGTWDLRSNEDGSGVGGTFGPGEYSDFSTFAGPSINDTVSLAIAQIA
ncbi:beta/gamma crystallin-related protein [Nostoc sp.]|uniref:beta/gamma crystallin-related protein n=1 Tax=Nostoc sp. TaxID=1180 RepID=UPI002FFBF492